MFTKAFWVATAERVVASAAGAVTSIVAADEFTSTISVEGLKAHGLVALGGGLFSLLKALAALGLTTGGSPSLTPKAEVDSALAPLTEGH